MNLKPSLFYLPKMELQRLHLFVKSTAYSQLQRTSLLKINTMWEFTLSATPQNAENARPGKFSQVAAKTAG